MTDWFWASKTGDIVGVSMGNHNNPTLIWYSTRSDTLEKAEDLARRLNEAVGGWMMKYGR